MKAYVLVWSVDYEGDTVEYVFLDEEEANACCLWLNGGAKNPRGSQRYEVREFDIMESVADVKKLY